MIMAYGRKLRMKFSVVVVAKNAERTIGYTIRSLLRQTIKPNEIIIVVDSLEDPTVKAVRDLPVKVVLNEEAGLGGARKMGVDASLGDIMAFIDTDCAADEKWIESLVEGFSSRDITAQAGKTIRVRSLTEISSRDTRVDEESPKFLKFALTENFAFRKELIDSVGNFDPWLKRGGEDLDFCIRLRKVGYKIYYNPSAKVYHAKAGSALKKAWRDGVSRSRNFIKHKKYMLTDALICFFHATSLLALIVLSVMGHPMLALLMFLPSLIHRLYRAAISAKHGDTILASLLYSLRMYVSYLSFIASLLNLALRKLTMSKDH